MLRILSGAGRQGALAAPERIRSTNERLSALLHCAAAVRRVGPVLRSVLITVLDLAHVHAARAPGLAPQPPQRELEAKRETRTHTQLHMLRGPGLLRSVLVSALDLAHVHAAPASNSAGRQGALAAPERIHS